MIVESLGSHFRMATHFEDLMREEFAAAFPDLTLRLGPLQDVKAWKDKVQDLTTNAIKIESYRKVPDPADPNKTVTLRATTRIRYERPFSSFRQEKAEVLLARYGITMDAEVETQMVASVDFNGRSKSVKTDSHVGSMSFQIASQQHPPTLEDFAKSAQDVVTEVSPSTRASAVTVPSKLEDLTTTAWLDGEAATDETSDSGN